jgi:hypothetical protein
MACSRVKMTFYLTTLGRYNGELTIILVLSFFCQKLDYNQNLSTIRTSVQSQLEYNQNPRPTDKHQHAADINTQPLLYTDQRQWYQTATHRSISQYYYILGDPL